MSEHVDPTYSGAMRVASFASSESILDMSLREMFEAATSWLNGLPEFLETLSGPNADPIVILLTVLAALVIFGLVMAILIRIIKAILWTIFKLDQVAHWLAGLPIPERRRHQRTARVRYGRAKVDNYVLDPKEARSRRKEWQDKLLTDKEVQKIQENARKRL